MRARRGRFRSRGAALAGVLGCLLLGLTACSDGSTAPQPPPTPSTSSASAVQHLTFGVYGPPQELAAYRRTVDAWNATSQESKVSLVAWPNHRAMRRAVQSGQVPDVFLASRGDLPWLQQRQLTQPVDELLDDRGLDFGDNYSRPAIEAFSADDRLQCMPYGVSPMVVYYNTKLINFNRMRRQGLQAPDPDSTSWSFDQFAAAAQFATHPGRMIRGVHIDPTLAGLTPFIVSGGGTVFDSASNPTSLNFSSGDTRSALERALPLLRDPRVTLSPEQLRQAPALTWFERGKLGMLVGNRSLVPRLRRVHGLDFNVMAMPTLNSSATVGDVTGLCLSASTASTSAAADFMVHELSPEAVRTVTRTGYLQPANLQVALTDRFLQPKLQPRNSTVFNSAVRSMTVAPLTAKLQELETRIEPHLRQLVYGVGALDLDPATTRIDEESRAVLQPPSPSGSPTGSPSPSPSG